MTFLTHTHRRMAVLSALHGREAAVTSREIAPELGLDLTTLESDLRWLEREGRVAREPLPKPFPNKGQRFAWRLT